MNYEVEQKHCVDDPSAFIERLAGKGIELMPAIEQSDEYFAHPCRDFAQTDEALRIRSVGDRSYVTYKGPKLDATTKTRREIELPLDAMDRGGKDFAKLLAALGFLPVAVVRKERRPFHLERGGRKIEGALDCVDGVGTFVELEIVADETGLGAARQVIAALAMDLDLGASERRSYLELLLGK